MKGFVFTATSRYALEKQRERMWTPQGMSDEDAVRLAGMREEEHAALLTGPLEGMLIGAEKMDGAAILATASSISARTKEINRPLT